MSPWLARTVVALALAGVGAWLVSATEWADTEVSTPASGQARTDPFYALQVLLRELGVAVVRRDALDALPPPQARLVLASNYWDLFPERTQRLRLWVEQGGHLVLPNHLVDNEQLKGWLPLVAETPDEADEDDEDDTPPPVKPASRARKPGAPALKDANGRDVAEPQAVPASFAGGRGFTLCGVGPDVRYRPSDERAAALWSVEDAGDLAAVRVRVGRGTVTVVPWGLQTNANLARADNALFMAAAFQLRTGTEVWLVAEEKREPFMQWLWHRGWAALLLGMLALAAALWRAAVRFGPLELPAGAHRRSMAEQVRGTASFLHMHGADALHTAQLRALQECARRQVHRYVQLNPAARAASIARATGLDAAALERAMATRKRSTGTMALDLELLETARRRLDAAAPVAATDASFPPSSTP